MHSDARRRGRVLRQPGPWCLYALRACSAGLHALTECRVWVQGARHATGVRWVHRLPTSTPHRRFACLFPFFRLCWHDPGAAQCIRMPGAVDVYCGSRAHGACTLCVHAQQDVCRIPDRRRGHDARQESQILATPASTYFYFFSDANTGQWSIAVSDLHVLVPVFRVQGRAVQSGANKKQVAHSNLCFAE